jgi:hypothetical protein
LTSPATAYSGAHDTPIYGRHHGKYGRARIEATTHKELIKRSGFRSFVLIPRKRYSKILTAKKAGF